MKSTTILVTSILLTSISILTSSCKSDELSRDTAEKLIRSNFQKTEVREFKLYDGGYEYGSMQGRGGEVKLHQMLANLGVIDLIERHGEMAEFFPGIQSMKLTAKGKQYVVSSRKDRYYTFAICKLADIEFGEITGISQQKGSNTALVKYTQVRKVTPFGTAVNLNDGPYELSVNFTKYDDGWRIDK